MTDLREAELLLEVYMEPENLKSKDSLRPDRSVA
jgi:hypothetical protein